MYSLVSIYMKCFRALTFENYICTFYPSYPGSEASSFKGVGFESPAAPVGSGSRSPCGILFVPRWFARVPS
jgi:hypothetical protein